MNNKINRKLILLSLIAALLPHMAWAMELAQAMEAVQQNILQECRRLLAEPGIHNVNAVGEDGSTDLMVASFLGNQEVITLLLAAGADVDVADRDGCTALMIAARWGNQDVVQLLINNA